MDKPHENLAVALDALEKGLVPIPIVVGTKTPAVKWKPWQTSLPPEELVREWFSVRRNIAIVTTGMVVFDCDEAEKAELVLAECGETPHKIATPRGGIHLAYRRRRGLTLANQVKIKGMPIDIRTNGGLEIIPASFTEHGEYRWLGELHPVSSLPCGNIAWTRERVKKVVRKPHTPFTGESQSGVRNPEAYCLKISSIQGSNGSAALVRCVCVLRDAGVPPGRAWDFLTRVWNPQCAEPTWSEAELMHAMKRHYGEK